MYDDDPQWRVMFNYLKAMYHSHPIREDIAGTVESIAKITPDLLYRCYNTFYNLGNMVLALAGNFDAEKVLEVCDRMLKPAEPVTVNRVFLPEPNEIVEPYVEKGLSVVLPMFQFGFKEPDADKPRSERDVAAMEVLLETLASDASPLFRQLMDRCGLTQEEVAKKLAKSRSAIANSLRLLALPAPVLELLRQDALTAGHAKAILGLPGEDLQCQAASQVVAQQLNVRQTEALCRRLARPPVEKPAVLRPALPTEVEVSLREVLGNEVKVDYKDGKGSLTLHFYSDDQLKAFANLLGQYNKEQPNG